MPRKKKTRTDVICVEDSDDEELKLMDLIRKSETIFINDKGKIDKNGYIERKLVKDKNWVFIEHDLNYEFIGLLDADTLIKSNIPDELVMFT